MTKLLTKTLLVAAVLLANVTAASANVPDEDQVRADVTGEVSPAGASVATDSRFEAAPAPFNAPAPTVANDREGRDFAVLLD